MSRGICICQVSGLTQHSTDACTSFGVAANLTMAWIYSKLNNKLMTTQSLLFTFKVTHCFTTVKEYQKYFTGNKVF